MNVKTKMERYEDAYKDAWEEQVKIDRTLQPTLRKPYYNHHNRAQHVANGKLGGAPRLQLTKEAEVFNRMLANGMSQEEITHIMGVDPKHVDHVVKRFRLPRKD
jgi:hypothetical protein